MKLKPGMLSKNRLQYFRPFSKTIVFLFLMELGASLFYLVGPYFSKLFIDNSFIKKNLAVFLKLTALGGIVFVVSVFAKLIQDWIRNRLKIKVKLRLANIFISRLYAQDLAFFQSNSIGENMYRISDLEQISSLLLDNVPALAVGAIRLVIVLGVAVWLNLPMTLFVLLASPLFLLQSVYMRKRLTPYYEKIWKSNAELLKKIQEAFSKIVIVKIFGLEPFQRHIYIRALIKNIRLGVSMFKENILYSLGATFLSKAIFGGLSVYGGWLIIKDKVSLGTYAATMMYLGQLGGLIKSLSSGYAFFIQESVSVTRFFEIMERQPAIQVLPDGITRSSLQGAIAFRNLNFGYSPERIIVKGLNLTIAQQSWCAIVGPSGCGKTTLINLILRLYDPLQGEVLIDGIDLKKLDLVSYRKRISIAAQEPMLFDLSLKDNIAYGLTHISPQEIEEAARTAQLDEFVSKLPQGYDTPIGENAVRLSQGLKQRVALARAIIRNPDILILDEATSSLDSSTEAKIFQRLRLLRQGKSTIIVSHRLFAVKDADCIYLLGADSRIEKGTCAQLSEESSFFRELFRNQLDEVSSGLEPIA